MKQLYMEVLRLDNFLQALTESERTMIHQYHAGYRTQLPLIVYTLYEYIKIKNWEAPDFRYNPERVLTWYNENTKTWEPIEAHKLYRAKVER